MKKYLISSFLILVALTCMGQQKLPPEEVLRITQFGGLNTRQGDFSIQPNEFRQLDGFDLNRYPGSLAPRFGYDNQGVIAGADSLIGIFGAYFSDGRQRLFYIIDSNGTGYGNIYVTNFNSTSGQTRVATEWPVINKPTFAIFQDRVYITNGNGRSLVYDNEIAKDFPLRAPAEPKIVPLNTSGNLNGEYVYMFAFRETAAIPFDTVVPGEHSARIKVQNGQVLIKDFTWMPGWNQDQTPDSIWIRIYRTKGNPGILDEGDTAYWTGTDIIATSAAALADSSFVDNVADGSLNSDSAWPVVIFEKVGNSGVYLDPRYGAPMYSSAGNGADSGFVGGTPPNRWGFAYRYTILDTATNLESPLSPPFYWQYLGTDDSLNIVIPDADASTTGYKKNVYRAFVGYTAWDTTWQNVPQANGLLNQAQQFLRQRRCIRLANGDYKCYISEQPIYDPGGEKDSIYTDNYFLVTQLDVGDTIFTDTRETRHDSVTFSFQNLYDPSFPMTPLDGIVSLEDRLFGFYGSAVAFSRLDDDSRWFIFDRVSVSAQDGQRITVIWGQRDALRVGKTESLHNFYQTADTLWNLSEVTHHIGVIAPHSVAQGLGGTYYYTDYGVMRENEGLYRDRQFGVEPISWKIAALDTLPVSSKVDALGTYYNQMYILSLPQLGDSGQSYVYFERANAWARWPNLCFGGATLYSTETNLSFLPGDTLYFFKPGGSTIYRMTSDTADNVAGTPFAIKLAAETAPLFTDDLRWEKNIQEVGVGIRSPNSNDTLVVAYKNEEDVTQFTDTLFDSSERYTLLGGRSNALFWKLNLQNSSNHSWGNTIIDRLDVYYRETVKDKVK